MTARSSVTAVVVTRDRPRLVADALASIASQRLAPAEVRVGEDGEGEPGRLPAALGRAPLTVLRTGAGRPGEARNRAARGAAGDLLAFLDDDDRWLPDHLERMVPAFDDPAVELAFADCAVIRERIEPDGTRVEIARRRIALDWDPARARRDHVMPPSAWVLRRALFDRLAGFDPTLRFTEDWDFVLRAARVTTPRRVLGQTVEIRLRDEGHLSQERGRERRACLDRIAARHGLEPPAIRDWWEVAGMLEQESGHA